MARIIGAETEYGIATPADLTLSPIVSSTHAVVAYALKHQALRRSRWDFAAESPLRDARGFDLRRYHTVPTIDPNAIGVANVMLHNGGRFYVDHAHPEYSTPEVTSAIEAARYDAAGDLVLRGAAALLEEHTRRNESVLDGHAPCPALKLYKNNVDGKGASYGAHENYSYSRSTLFETLAQALIPFFIARMVFIGAGRVGKGPRGDGSGFQISQRADYIEQAISLETTMNRGIINTRDESHSNEKTGRLHVIIGDANMSHTSMLLKYGMTSLVLDAIERGVDFSDLNLEAPVEEVRKVSYDLTLTHRMQLSNGEALTALEVLQRYRERVEASTQEDAHVLQVWDEVASALQRGPEHASDLLDWCAKLSLIRSFEQRGVPMESPKMQAIDLQYTDIDPAKSLYHALVRKGRMRELFTHNELHKAQQEPPTDTRAYFRGKAQLCPALEAASWERITINGQVLRIADLRHPNASDCQRAGFDVEEFVSGTVDVEKLEHISGVERVDEH
ncbi:depupylase/deamidase Dop [Corynebacterium gerontici]|uniref:Pup deamidase/depupylase n=1 Tax=Corynebacterium gerontici TaxID=2079234 RepID=A0A3G6J4T9_9CORY|nr:depupylase/deamidase Dop [Corynebacterium gerontici]AZA11420.1 Pup deamidase/depupylase [Corynebacterium gerontici]